MITKAIIETADTDTGLYNPDSMRFKIRVPVFESYSGADKAIMEANAIAMPGYIPNYQPGDVVYIAFEDNSLNDPLILGGIFKGNQSAEGAVDINSAVVSKYAKLPGNTVFGDDMIFIDLYNKVLELEAQLKNISQGDSITLTNLDL